MKKIYKYSTVLLLLSLLGACAARGPYKERIVRVRDMKNNQSSLVYGQIVMPSDMWYMEHVMLQRVGKVYVGMGLRGTSEPIYVSPDGKFVCVNIKPGKYMLSGFLIGSNMSHLGKQALNYTIEVKPGKSQYFGALKYIEGKQAGAFRMGTFGLEYDKTKARHAEILNWVSKSTVNTKWQGPVNKKLKKYKRYLPKEVKQEGKKMETKKKK
ncbi:MAG: hypothetical protein OEV42_20870 [Deltaproteobacteria bacterium]|nr:hypothetical protein [Deltaproteobacteria bacterium]